MTDNCESLRSEAVFTGAFEREARVSADRRTVTHSAMEWSMDYSPGDLIRWIGFYERMLEQRATPHCRADVEALHRRGTCWPERGWCDGRAAAPDALPN